MPLPLSSENLSTLVPTLCSYMHATAGSVIHFKLQSCSFHTVVMKELLWVLMTSVEVEEAFTEANIVLLKMCLKLMNFDPVKLKSMVEKERRKTNKQLQEFTARSLSATRKSRVSKGLMKHYSDYLTFNAKDDVLELASLLKNFKGCILNSKGDLIHGQESGLPCVRTHLSEIATKLHEEQGMSRVPRSLS
mmetsp:Transcript_19198/g.35090  ORF Transcript_19198/g.35090 Transcript_19198/m.35090 type:complete len:191 (+) Transcript_19198:100-672(+)